MSKLPIRIKRIKTEDYNRAEFSRFLVTLLEKDTYWQKSAIVDRSDLLKLKEELDELLGQSTLAEKLNVPSQKAAEVAAKYQFDPLCANCSYKESQTCLTCLFVMQSPLERKLLLALTKAGIFFKPQFAIGWKGESLSIHGRTYEHPTYNFKDVLTVVDFYIEHGPNRICVFTDGNTYHSRNDVQHLKDQMINDKLLEYGYKLLRFSTGEVENNIDDIISKINNCINEKSYS